VIESKLKLPKFSGFRCVGSSKDTPPTTGEINFNVNDRIGKLDEWIKTSFITDSNFVVSRMNCIVQSVVTCPVQTLSDKVKAYFVSVVPSSADSGPQPLHIHAAYRVNDNVNESRREGMTLAIRIRCNSMSLAADLIQDLAKHFGVSDLSTEADFPTEFAEFGEVSRSSYLILKKPLKRHSRTL
jgi:hypothetical protein